MRGSRDHNSELSELTDDLAEERGELEAFSQEPIGDGRGEQTFLREADHAAALTPRGSPDADSMVRSVYDTRPINTRDFLIPVLTVEPAAPGTTTFDFTVPDGLVAFLRSFRYQLAPVPVLGGLGGFRVTLTVDDAPVLDYFDLPLGPVHDFYVPTFVIANSLQRIGARFQITGAFTVAGTELLFEFYGQFKQSDGRSATLQVGNQVPGPPRFSNPPVASRPRSRYARG